MQKFIRLIILFFVMQSSFAQSASEYLSGANTAYKAGNYAQAKTYFIQALAQQDTAFLNYNLANTCEKLGEIGEAKAYYMRAIYQNPRFKEAIFNLNALDKKYALSSFNTTRADLFFDELSHNEWLILSAIFLWLAIFFLIILPFLKVNKPWQYFLGLIFIATFALSASGVYYWNCYANTVVALVDNAPLRYSPTKDSTTSSTLKAGQLANIKKQNKDYALLESSSKKGWAILDNKDFMQVSN